MVTFPRFPPVNPLVPPVGGAVAGVAVAALFLAVPSLTLEDWVWSSGLPALVAAAAPPLGTTARMALALAGGAMAASVVWSLLYLIVGPGGLLAPKTPASAVPVVRRADAHPDAPPRRPMTAADLGTPLMEVAAPPPFERPVPRDLNQPLAAFDPGAILPVPLPPPASVPPMARKPIIAAVPEPLAPGERIDTYVLTPPVAPVEPVSKPRAAEPILVAPKPRRPEPIRSEPLARLPEPIRPAIVEKPSIEALLRRLEEVAAQRMAMGR